MGKIVKFDSETRRAARRAYSRDAPGRYPRKSGHGVHRKRGIFARARGQRRSRGGWVTGGTILTLSLATFLAVFAWPAGNSDTAQPIALSSSSAPAIHFTICGSGRRINCVVDGDTFWMAGEKIRILDIDTPETHPPRCPEEARLGEAATARLHALLNAGPVDVQRDGSDRYGRTLATITRGGLSLGDTLVSEGLARPYGGGRRSWCD